MLEERPVILVANKTDLVRKRVIKTPGIHTTQYTILDPFPGTKHNIGVVLSVAEPKPLGARFFVIIFVIAACKLMEPAPSFKTPEPTQNYQKVI